MYIAIEYTMCCRPCTNSREWSLLLPHSLGVPTAQGLTYLEGKDVARCISFWSATGKMEFRGSPRPPPIPLFSWGCHGMFPGVGRGLGSHEDIPWKPCADSAICLIECFAVDFVGCDEGRLAMLAQDAMNRKRNQFSRDKETAPLEHSGARLRRASILFPK